MTCKFMAAVTLLMLSSIAAAQELPDAPSVTIGHFPSPQVAMGPASTAGPAMPPETAGSTAGLSAPALRGKKMLKSGAAVGAKKPWIDPAVADVNYWASTSALFATTIINVEYSARCADQRTCLTEIAPGATRAKLYAYTLPTDILVSYVSYRLKRTTHWWWFTQAVLSGANMFSAGRSFGRLR